MIKKPRIFRWIMIYNSSSFLVSHYPTDGGAIRKNTDFTKEFSFSKWIIYFFFRLQLERSKYLVADLKEAFDDDTDQEETEGKVVALCRYILQKEDGKAEGKVPPIPYRFVALPVCQEVIWWTSGRLMNFWIFYQIWPKNWL